MHGFLSDTLHDTPDARAAKLMSDPGARAAHADVVHEGQSAVADDTTQHFVTLVCRQGRLLELDGFKAHPIDHGPSTPESLLEDAVVVLRQFMARDPEELRFTMLALAPPGEDEGEDGEAEGGAEVPLAPTGEEQKGGMGAPLGQVEEGGKGAPPGEA